MNPKQLAKVERLNVVLTVLASLAGFLWMSVPVALGLTVGGFISCANFYAIHKLVDRSINSKKKSSNVARVLLGVKMVLLMGVIFAAIRYLPLNAIALTAGFSIFLISIAIEAVRFALRTESDGQKASVS